MGKTVDTKIDDGILTFTFTNEQNEVFASFKMNPTDINLALRCEETLDYFNEKKENAPEMATTADAVKYNKELEEKLNYILGYDATTTLFKKPYTATTIFPDGNIFALIILDVIFENVAPEIEKRNKKSAESMAKYTDKYTK